MRKEAIQMERFIPREKLSKKAKKKLAAKKRITWTFSPVTRKVESKRVYNRKRISRAEDDGREFFSSCSMRNFNVFLSI